MKADAPTDEHAQYGDDDAERRQRATGAATVFTAELRSR